MPQLDTKKAIWGWTMYDWANSSFATTVIAGFFPVFFKLYWSAGVETTMSTARLGFANSIASIIVALLAPVLGAIADRSTARKKFLTFFAYLGALMSAALYLVAKGQWPVAVLLFALGNIGFSGGNVFYDSLLPGVASEKKMDMASSLGYSMGYLGGGLLFALNVFMTLKPAVFGFQDSSMAVRFSFLSVGLWWAIFSLPILLFVKEPETTESVSGIEAIKAGFRQLAHTFQEIRHLKQIFLFLAAYWLYMDGVDTIIRMAIDYGMSIGLNSNDLIVALLITQFVGFPAAIGFGYLGGKIGAKPAIFLAIAVYLGVSIWGAFMQTTREFYTMAIIIGLVQGGIQALSRSYYARIIPANKSAEYFGFYNMLGKFAAVIGPVLMGGVGLLVNSSRVTNNLAKQWGIPISSLASRLSITSISILFIVGGVLFYFVNEQKAKAEIQYLA